MSTIQRQQSKRLYIERIIFVLARNMLTSKRVPIVVSNLEKIYDGGYRYRYSMLLPLLKNLSEGSDFDTDVLAYNINELVDFINAGTMTDVRKSILEMCEQIEIELSRLLIIQSHEKRLCQLNDAQKQLLNEKEMLNSRITQAEEKYQNSQTELMIVLSVFAAIVITFSGSLGAISSALTGMASVNYFKGAFFVLLCGWTSFNTIYLLLHLVGKITGRNIYATCVVAECCKCDCNCCGVTKVRKRLPYVFWLNVGFLVLMCLDLFCVWQYCNYSFGQMVVHMTNCLK